MPNLHDSAYSIATLKQAPVHWNQRFYNDGSGCVATYCDTKTASFNSPVIKLLPRHNKLLHSKATSPLFHTTESH